MSENISQPTRYLPSASTCLVIIQLSATRLCRADFVWACHGRTHFHSHCILVGVWVCACASVSTLSWCAGGENVPLFILLALPRRRGVYVTLWGFGVCSGAHCRNGAYTASHNGVKNLGNKQGNSTFTVNSVTLWHLSLLPLHTCCPDIEKWVILGDGFGGLALSKDEGSHHDVPI